MSRIADIAQRVLPWLAAATAAVAATRFLGDALWPCPVSCQGGGHYQRLFGVPVHVPAVAVMALVAVLAWRRRDAAAWLAWTAAGASLYFLWVAWMLSLRCPYCLTVHAGVLTTAILASGRPWLPRLALAGCAFLGLHFAFQPVVTADGPVVAPLPADPAGVSAFLAPGHAPAPVADRVDPLTDALRRRGSAQAAYVVELALDLHCSRCAEAHGPLLEALQRAIATGRAEVVLRFMVRASDPAGRELARHVLAAADASQSALLTSLLLGTAEGRGWADVRPRVAEIADPAALEAALIRRAPSIDALLEADGVRLHALRIRSTPAVVLSRRSGDVIMRWDGPTFDSAAIAREIPFD